MVLLERGILIVTKQAYGMALLPRDPAIRASRF